MRIDFLPEPELEFGSGHHIDVRFGLMNYGPFDTTSPLAPKRIRAAIVGSPPSLEGVTRWLEQCRSEIPPKPSRQPNLFPRFPGFSEDHTFRATVVLDSRLQRAISESSLGDLVGRASGDQLVMDAVALFIHELEDLVQNASPDVLVCAIPS
jgi:hypothetical protein